VERWNCDIPQGVCPSYYGRNALLYPLRLADSNRMLSYYWYYCLDKNQSFFSSPRQDPFSERLRRSGQSRESQRLYEGCGVWKESLYIPFVLSGCIGTQGLTNVERCELLQDHDRTKRPNRPLYYPLSLPSTRAAAPKQAVP
jgi:hypothetical protein